MKCKDLKYDYVDYLKGKVDEQLKSQIERHLKECEKCKEEIEKMRVLSHELDNYKIELPDNTYFINFIPKLNERLNVYKNHNKSKKVLNYALSFSTFLSIVLVLFFVLQIGYKELPYNVSINKNLVEKSSNNSTNNIETPTIEEIDPSIMNYEHYETNSLIQKIKNKELIERKATQLLASAVIEEHGDEFFSRDNLFSFIDELSDEEVDNMINNLKTKDILK